MFSNKWGTRFSWIFQYLVVFIGYIGMALATDVRYLTYSGRIVDDTGNPLNGAVQFNFKFTDTLGTCVLWEENLTDTVSAGAFALQIGRGTNVFDGSGSGSLEGVFKQGQAINCKGNSPTVSVTPANVDDRNMVMSFNDGSGWQTIANAIPIRSVPYALYSENVANLLGYAIAVTATPTNGQVLQFQTASNTWVPTTLGGGGGGLSQLTAATSTDTIDNANFAQTWNWSTATTQSPMSISANALTTGSLLNVTTSSGSLNSSNGLLNVANTSTSTNGIVARIQSNSTPGSGLTVLANGNVGIGTTTPGSALAVSGDTSVSGKLILPASTATTGQITLAGASFLHAYGTDNVFVGGGAGNFVKAGSQNVGIGTLALNVGNAGSNNTAIGYGAEHATTGDDNTAVGASALGINVAGWKNTAVGSGALSQSRTDNNTAVGYNSLRSLDLGTGGNTALGALAGFTSTPANGNVTGANNTYLGYDSGPNTATQLSNTTAIGYGARVSTSNQVVIGNSSVTTTILNGNVGIGTSTPGALLDVNGTMRVSQICDSVGANCKTVSGGWSAAAGLSALTAATATDTIDNTNFAQSWNWSTATTQNPMSLSANSLTTGSLLNLTSSSGSLNSSSGLLNVANTGASTTGTVVRFQSNSTAGSGLTVLANGNVGIGTTAPSSLFHIKDNSGTTGYVQQNIEQAGAGDAGISFLRPGVVRWTVGMDSADSDKLKFARSTAAPIFSSDTKMTIDNLGNVGIGTATPASTSKLEVVGAATSRTNIIASGATVNLSLGNQHYLKAPGGSAITLQNMTDGGVYTMVMYDTTSRTYTFSGCTNSYFSPANGPTLNYSTYSVLVVVDGANTNCFITWITGFN